MKKIIGILVIVMVFMLAGCEKKESYLDIELENTQHYTDCEWNSALSSKVKCVDELGVGVLITYSKYKEDLYSLDNQYYTQEEVNSMLQEQGNNIIKILYDNYVEYDDLDNIFYSNCIIVDGIKYCDIVLNLNDDTLEQRITEFENDLQTYLEENYQPLEECDSDCEIDKIDNQITITTIAQIDLVLYGLEHSQDPLTDEEQFVFDLYTQLREQLYLEVGGE